MLLINTVAMALLVTGTLALHLARTERLWIPVGLGLGCYTAIPALYLFG